MLNTKFLENIYIKILKLFLSIQGDLSLQSQPNESFFLMEHPYIDIDIANYLLKS